jgi:hypothetical protein
MNEITNLKFSLKTSQAIDSLINISAYSVTADLITGREYIAPGHAPLASVLYDYGSVIIKLKKDNDNNIFETNLFDTDNNTNEKNIKILFYIFENAAFQVSTELDTKTNVKYTNVLIAPYSNNFSNLSNVIDKEKFLEELKSKKSSLSNISQLINFKSGKKVNFAINKEKKMEYFITKILETFNSPYYLKYQN